MTVIKMSCNFPGWLWRKGLPCECGGLKEADIILFCDEHQIALFLSASIANFCLLPCLGHSNAWDPPKKTSPGSIVFFQLTASDKNNDRTWSQAELYKNIRVWFVDLELLESSFPQPQTLDFYGKNERKNNFQTCCHEKQRFSNVSPSEDSISLKYRIGGFPKFKFNESQLEPRDLYFNKAC